MRNLFDANAEVTTLIAEIEAGNAHYDKETAPYYELGAIKAELHMIAQRFPEVEAYLATVNRMRKGWI